MKSLELKNINYSYTKKKPLLKSISMTFEKGKAYAILGPSGCGKTTLLSLIGGLDEPTCGEITVNDIDINKKGLAYHRKHNVSFIFQSYNLIDYMTALENVKLSSAKSAKSALLQVGLTSDESERNVLKLSGGQQQRVAIARALGSEAEILLADEPTGNLDEGTAVEIADLLTEAAHKYGKCVIIVTHSLELAKRCNVILKLSKGQLG